MDPYAPEEMFKKGIQALEEINYLLNPEYIYRGEYLNSPKHHTVKYERVPFRNVILFDIELRDKPQTFLTWKEVQTEAYRLGLEFVPTYHVGTVENQESLLPYLEEKPCLGGEHIEGIVIKNYGLPGSDGKITKAKIVRADFAEIQGKEWRNQNPTDGDIAKTIINKLCTEARWNKAIQHLEERGELTNEPKDIGPLLKEISQDILDEESDAIKDLLFKHFWKRIAKGATYGFSEWYKRKLMGFDE
jgi:hypothetical protein